MLFRSSTQKGHLEDNTFIPNEGGSKSSKSGEFLNFFAKSGSFTNCFLICILALFLSRLKKSGTFKGLLINFKKPIPIKICSIASKKFCAAQLTLTLPLSLPFAALALAVPAIAAAVAARRLLHLLRLRCVLAPLTLDALAAAVPVAAARFGAARPAFAATITSGGIPTSVTLRWIAGTTSGSVAMVRNRTRNGWNGTIDLPYGSTGAVTIVAEATSGGATGRSNTLTATVNPCPVIE